MLNSRIEMTKTRAMIPNALLLVTMICIGMVVAFERKDGSVLKVPVGPLITHSQTPTKMVCDLRVKLFDDLMLWDSQGLDTVLLCVLIKETNSINHCM